MTRRLKMLRAIMALDSSYLGENEFGPLPFSLRQFMTAPQHLKANYDRRKYSKGRFLD
jgi:hypothetical protein